MKKEPIIFSLFGNSPFTDALQKKLDYKIGTINLHTFPDQEIVITIDTDIKDHEIILMDSLDHPNHKILPLLFAAETARELGATKIGLIAPYLAYMRQDKQFNGGEGITSKYFAKLISNYFDSLITFDPHLHRWHSLNQIYSIPTTVLHAVDAIARWIQKNLVKPLLIGPDNESSQWTTAVAQKVHVPYVILEKKRMSDDTVIVSIPQVELYQDHTPVLIDDIISTGNTLIETVKHLNLLKMNPAICIGVHAIFADNAYQNLLRTGVKQIVTCNTIPHISNGIDLSSTLIDALS